MLLRWNYVKLHKHSRTLITNLLLPFEIYWWTERTFDRRIGVTPTSTVQTSISPNQWWVFGELPAKLPGIWSFSINSYRPVFFGCNIKSKITVKTFGSTQVKRVTSNCLLIKVMCTCSAISTERFSDKDHYMRHVQPSPLSYLTLTNT